MVPATGVFLILMSVSGMAGAASAKPKEIIDPAEARADADFAVQGEYTGWDVQAGRNKQAVGAQVIAQGDGKFEIVVFQGGLPGAGWKRGDDRFSMQGNRQGEVTTLEGRSLSGKITGGKMTIADGQGKLKLQLQRIERKSPALEAKPPKGAVVLFDGSNADSFEHGQLTKFKTLEAGATSLPKFEGYKLHMEFRLSYMPQARGQGRSNSGVYIHDCYEIQVLDSFGLEGRDNECGGFYKVREPNVNMCLPPMVWQTYDIDFTPPRFDAGGKKVAAGRISVRHNGVVIHADLELPRDTPGRQGEGPGPRPIHLQGHGCHVQYRNIWLVPRTIRAN